MQVILSAVTSEAVPTVTSSNCCYFTVPIPTDALKTTTSVSAVSGKRCPKCATSKKSGKRSCCGPGGSWFKNCGDEKGSKFDHTWSEGTRACKGFASLFLDENQEQVLLRHEPTPANLNDTHSLSATNCEEFSSLSKVTVFISLLSIALHMSI